MDNSSSSQSAAILVAKFQLRANAENEFAAWQAQALTRAAGFHGFVNSEITPSGDALSWTVLLRFGNSERLDAWRKSDTWRRLLEDAQRLIAEKSSIEIEVKETGPDRGVVEVIVTKVKPGKEAAYREWETKVQQAQSKFPGYQGSYVQPPIAGELGWTTLMRFETTEQLDTLSPRLAGVNFSLGMFIGNVISVALTTYLTMPLFIKTFGWWLFPKSEESKITVNLAGTAVIFLLYAIEVAALWHLL